MQRSLSFDQAPPLAIPLRYFLSAPLFSLAAAVLLLFRGADALASRWSPVTLALTHLLTLGFLAMAMIGALLQILPVVAGVLIPWRDRTAGGVHVLLTCGTALLAAAFWWSQPVLFKLALLLLGGAFAWLLVACAVGFWLARRAAPTATVSAIRMAVCALLIAVTLGTTLAGALAWRLDLPLMLLTELHVAWGLPGWVGLLIVGVAFQVIPMFQVTPHYPRPLARWLPLALFLLLVLWSAATVISPNSPSRLKDAAAILLLTGVMLFALTTLYLLSRRTRPKPDATTLFWRAAMASLLACALLWLLQVAGYAKPMPMTLGVLFVYGFGYSAVNGMLYKIVPFLVWYHLQNSQVTQRRAVPGIKAILADRVAVRQFWSHFAALLLILAATIWVTIWPTTAPPALTGIAAAALCLSSGWLWWHLFSAARVHARLSQSAHHLG
jgi:hypothetical protein